MARAAQLAYDRIRAGIVSGAHEAGTRLREEELAGVLGVSRTPVREALRRLDAEGLVEFVPNRGAHVASWTEMELDEIFCLRALLESYGARLAAARIRPEQVAQLHQLAEQMVHVAGGPGGDQPPVRLADLNNQFHGLVLEAAGNARLMELVRSVVQLSLVQRTFRRYDADELARSLGHHRELAAALGAGDGDWAESVMRSHVLAARAACVQRLPANLDS